MRYIKTGKGNPDNLKQKEGIVYATPTEEEQSTTLGQFVLDFCLSLSSSKGQLDVVKHLLENEKAKEHVDVFRQQDGAIISACLSNPKETALYLSSHYS